MKALPSVDEAGGAALEERFSVFESDTDLYLNRDHPLYGQG